MNKRISVFGGSKPNPGESTYDEALSLGRALGKRKIAVLTGGYIGTMHAVSQGAAESGAHVIGVTCDEIEAYRPVSPNPWLSEEIRCTTLRERIYTLITECDAAIALPGGIGTLLEIVTMWNIILINAIAPRPILLLGSGWLTVVSSFFQTMDIYVPAPQRELVTFFPDIERATAFIEEL